MNFIFGLGNPGEKYQRTRHNLGFMVLDALAGENAVWKKSKRGKSLYTRTFFNNQEVELIKPQAFMNESGFSVSYALKKHQLTDFNQVYVVHDDLDIKLGEFKIQFGKGPHDHNGLLSIYQHLKTKDFWHVRVGVDGRQGLRNIPTDKYVLGGFSGQEWEIIKTVINQVSQELSQVLVLPI